jgi:hypothetical protein
VTAAYFKEENSGGNGDEEENACHEIREKKRVSFEELAVSKNARKAFRWS